MRNLKSFQIKPKYMQLSTVRKNLSKGISRSNHNHIYKKLSLASFEFDSKLGSITWIPQTVEQGLNPSFM